MAFRGGLSRKSSRGKRRHPYRHVPGILFRLQAKVLAVSNEGIVIDMRAASGLRIGQKGKYNHFKGIRNSAGKSVCQSNKFAGDVVVTEVQPDGTLVKADSFTETHESDTATFDAP